MHYTVTTHLNRLDEVVEFVVTMYFLLKSTTVLVIDVVNVIQGFLVVIHGTTAPLKREKERMWGYGYPRKRPFL